MTTPLERGDLGEDDLCPYCEQPQADFALVFFRQRPVCSTCAPILIARRARRRGEPLTAEQEDLLTHTPNLSLAGAGGLKHPEDRLGD